MNSSYLAIAFRMALLTPVVMLASCSSPGEKDFVSPSGALKLSYKIAHDDQQSSGFVLSSHGKELARTPSTAKQEAIDPVDGLPVNHEILWSPTERTALIFENTSDASPDYKCYLFQQPSGSDSWRVSEANFGSAKNPTLSPGQMFSASHRVLQVKWIDDQSAGISRDPQAPVERMPWSEVRLKAVSGG